MTHRSKAAVLAALAGAMPLLAQAAVVRSDYNLVSGNTWFADFAGINDGNPSQITGFTIDFPAGLFGLSLDGSPSTWNSLLIPPDAGSMAAGSLDSLAVTAADAIGAGRSQGGFQVRFDHLAGSTPPALSFDIDDPSFAVVFSGTTLVTAIPEPVSMRLAGPGFPGLLAAMRRQRSPASQDASEMTA